jgi:tRNA pseudouridine55 synthase
VPPMYSAVKHEGRRLYELAREGREVARRAREIEIHALTIERFDWPYLTLSVHCSKGTYVRTLVSDLANGLGTVAHVTELRRLGVGPFEEPGMVTLAVLEAAAADGLEGIDQWLLGPDAALAGMHTVSVSDEASAALRHGRRICIAGPAPEGRVRIYDPAGRFVGIGELDCTGSLKPARIFPP